MHTKNIDRLPASLRILRSLPLPRKLGLLESIFGKKLASLGVKTVKCSNGITWTLDLNEVTHRWLLYGDYEGPHLMSWLKNFLCEGGTFIDSGANIGQYVLNLSHLPRVQTFAFEPVTQEREWLHRCLNRYPEWNVEIVPFALGNSNSKIPIRIAGGKSTFRKDWYINQDLREELVAMTSLDTFTAERKIEHIKLWKLDMEGYEPQALAGAQSLLVKQRIDALLIEAQTTTLPDIEKMLSVGRYQLFAISKLGRLEPATKLTNRAPFTGNLIALPPNSRWI